MKKISTYVALITLTLFYNETKAQNKTTLANTPGGIIYSVAVNSGVNTGKLRESHRWGLGGTVQADIPLADKLYTTVNAGYMNFFGRGMITGTHRSVTDARFIPVKAGLKYFPLDKFYVQAEAGSAFALNKSDLGYNRSAAFIYSPQIGVRFPVGSKNVIDAGVFYERSSKFLTNSNDSRINFLGVKLAYGLSFGG